MISNSLLPSKTTIGIIDEGKGSNYLALTAKRLGFKVGVYTADPSRVFKIANFVIRGTSLMDKDKLKMFASQCDLVTYLSVQLNDQIVHYLQRFTKVPQGSEILDIMHDRSILQAFLSLVGVPTISYQTIVSLNDIRKAAASFGYPVILKPIQRSLLHDRQLVIKNDVGIAAAAGMLRAGTYILEPDRVHCRYFSVLVTKSLNQTCGTFPLIEKFYSNHHLIAANTFRDDSDKIGHRMKEIALKISKKIHYFGSLEVSLILSSDNRIYVSEISPAFSLSKVLFDRSFMGLDEEHLRALVGANVKSVYPSIPRVFVKLNRKNYDRFSQEWFKNSAQTFCANPLLNDSSFVLMATDAPEKVIQQLKIR